MTAGMGDVTLWIIAFIVFFIDAEALTYGLSRNTLSYDPAKEMIAHLLALPSTVVFTFLALEHGNMLFAGLGGAAIAVLIVYYIFTFRGE